MPKQSLKDVVKEIDILILLKHFKLVPINADTNIRFGCPFHKSESKITVDINLHNNKMWCWGCNKSYDTIDIFQHFNHLTFKQTLSGLLSFTKSAAYTKLKQYKNTSDTQQKIMTDEEIIIKKQYIKKHYSPVLNKVAAFYNQKLLNNQEALHFLHTQRKINVETIKKFNIGYSDSSYQKLSNHFSQQKEILKQTHLIKYSAIKNFYLDALQNGYVLPIMHNDCVFSFYKYSHQQITKQNPKYLGLHNISQTPIFYFLYGFSLAFKTIIETKKMIIHEGFFDVINCHQNGITNAVGLIVIKSRLSEGMLKILKKYHIKVIIGLDNDEAGRLNSKGLQEQLNAAKIKNTIRNIPTSYSDCKDADDILKKYGATVYQNIYLKERVNMLEPKEQQQLNRLFEIVLNQKYLTSIQEELKQLRKTIKKLVSVKHIKAHIYKSLYYINKFNTDTTLLQQEEQTKLKKLNISTSTFTEIKQQIYTTMENSTQNTKNNKLFQQFITLVKKNNDSSQK